MYRSQKNLRRRKTQLYTEAVLEAEGLVESIGDDKLLKNRTIIISQGIDSKIAKKVIGQLLTLEHDDPGKPINMFLNSPGGEVNSGYAIFDTVRFVSSPVNMITSGLCASIATVINVAVPKERRYSLPNSKFLIHQPLIGGQVRGQASDLEITANEIMKTRTKINKLLSESCSQPIDKVEQDTNRDYWMTAEESLEYGLIGKIITKNSEIK